MTSNKLTNGERLVVIEEQMKQNNEEHKQLKVLVERIDKKLDDFRDTTASKQDLLTKADKEDFDHVKKNQETLQNRLWYVVVTLLFMLISGLAYLLVKYNSVGVN